MFNKSRSNFRANPVKFFFLDCPADAGYVDLNEDFDTIVKKVIIVDGKDSMVYDEDIQITRKATFTLKPKGTFTLRSIKIQATGVSKVSISIKSKGAGVVKAQVIFLKGCNCFCKGNFLN